MPITDLQQENQSPPQTGAPPAGSNVDIGGQVVDALVRTGIVQPPGQTAAERRSQFQTALEGMKANSDPGAVEGMKVLFGAFSEDLTAKQRADMQVVMKGERDRAALNLIGMYIDGQVGDDALLKEYAPLLKDKVVYEINNNPEYKVLLQQHVAGRDIDHALLKKLVVTESSKLTRGREEKKPKTAAGIGAESSTKEQQAMVKDSGKVDDGDDDTSYGAPPGTTKKYETMGLSREYEPETSQERSLYAARLGTSQRNGWKRDSKAAVQYARNGIKNLRAGKEKAKAAGFPAMAGFMPERWH
jgi:hypothetical protein